MSLTSCISGRARKVYSYAVQLAKGKEAEALLDAYFSHWYRIEVIPHEVELEIGSDRLFVDPYGNQTVVEYKADYIGHRSGNVFLETLQFNHLNGWVYTTQADVLVYWVVGTGQVLAVRPPVLRDMLARWRATYPTVGTANETSRGAGVLLPITELQKVSIFEGVLYDAQAPLHLA